jgi:lysophospholipase L1-like esterase
MTDPIFLASITLDQQASNTANIPATSVPQNRANQAAIAAEKQRLNQILLQLRRKDMQPKASTSAPEFSSPTLPSAANNPVPNNSGLNSSPVPKRERSPAIIPSPAANHPTAASAPGTSALHAAATRPTDIPLIPLPINRPHSGKQLYGQRIAALQAGQFHTRIPVDSFQDRWQGANRQPSYEQWRSLLAQEAAMVANDPDNPPVGILLGDSISQWYPSDRLPQTRLWLNQAISGETSSHILRRLSDFSTTRPRIIYVMAGVNDLKQGASDAQVLANLQQIIQRLQQNHPQAQIVMQSILPTRLFGLSKNRIRNLNQQLKAIALNHGAYFLNLYSEMVGPQGNLRPDLTTDGLHLNAKGYETWQNVLQQAELQIARGQ